METTEASRLTKTLESFLSVAGRVLLVASYADDVRHHLTEFSGDVAYVEERLHVGNGNVPWMLCTALLATEIAVTVGACLCLVGGRAVLPSACFLLGFNTLRPMWQVTRHWWFERCAASIGGFLLLVAESAAASDRSAAAALSGLLLQTVRGEARKVVARCVLCCVLMLHLGHPALLVSMPLALLLSLGLCAAIMVGHAVRPCCLALAALLLCTSVYTFDYWDEWEKHLKMEKRLGASHPNLESSLAMTKTRYLEARFQFYQTLTTAGGMLLLARADQSIYKMRTTNREEKDL